MKINITGKNIEVTSAIRNHIEGKLKKLENGKSTLLAAKPASAKSPTNRKNLKQSLAFHAVS